MSQLKLTSFLIKKPIEKANIDNDNGNQINISQIDKTSASLLSQSTISKSSINIQTDNTLTDLQLIGEPTDEELHEASKVFPGDKEYARQPKIEWFKEHNWLRFSKITIKLFFINFKIILYQYITNF